MTAAIGDLYRSVILEHGKRPRNRGPLAGATHVAALDNPLCGDALHVEVALAGEVLKAVRFTGESCAIATASASLMTERVEGATRADVGRLADEMEALCATGTRRDEQAQRALGDLVVFAGVHRHPVRIGCALLAWRALRSALRI